MTAHMTADPNPEPKPNPDPNLTLTVFKASAKGYTSTLGYHVTATDHLFLLVSKLKLKETFT